MNESTPAAFLKETGGRVTAVGMLKAEEDVPYGRFMNSFALFWQLVALFVLVSGFFGNVMIIVICRRGDVMSSMSVYFITLAISDLLSLFVNALNQWMYFVFGIDLMSLNTLTCRVGGWLAYVSGVLSAWMLVGMTVQRAVCVLWPHRANILCSARNSKVIAMSMTFCITVIHWHLLYGLHVVIFINGTDEMNNIAMDFNDSTHTTNNTVLTLNDSKYTSSKVDVTFKHNSTSTAIISRGGTQTAAVCVVTREYVEFYFSVWSWADLLIVSVLPWLCLVVSNSVLLWTLNVSIRQAQHSLGSAHTDGFSGRKKQASSMTLTLFVASMAYIVLILPITCVQLLGFYHHMVGSLDYYYQSTVIAYFYEIALALWQTNSAVNFYLYCLTGSKFRRELKKMLSRVMVGIKTRDVAPSSTKTSSYN